MKKRVLVAGCGFLGLAVARCFLARGWDVTGMSRSGEPVEGLRMIACDLTDRAALQQHPELSGLDAVVHCASSGRGDAAVYRSVYLEGTRALMEVLNPRHYVFTSSTSVYAQTDGSVVTEESAAAPVRETGRVLREAEEFVLQNAGTVARVAGIYGPGRSVLLRKFLAGEAVIEGEEGRIVNQIHRDDAAEAFAVLIDQRARGIFNVVDDEPMTQRALYTWLAGRFDRPIPPTGAPDPNRKRGWTNKRVSNAKLRALGWTLRYPSFRNAVEGDPGLLAGLH